MRALITRLGGNTGSGRGTLDSHSAVIRSKTIQKKSMNAKKIFIVLWRKSPLCLVVINNAQRRVKSQCGCVLEEIINLLSGWEKWKV